MKRYFHVARFVLEARSPLMIASGEADPNLDVLLARDANGLPMIPATSLAGALRHLACDDDSFGKAGKIEETRASDFVFSDGLIQLSDGRPREGLIFDPPQSDPLWQLYQEPNPVQRDHVKLDEHGVAEATAKFQRGAVPAGSRFHCEISMMCEEENDEFRKLLDLLTHPFFALGGARRSGYGAMKLVSCKTSCFDLKEDKDWEAYKRFYNSAIDETGALSQVELSQVGSAQTMSFSLISEGFVTIGSDGPPIGEVAKAPDATPYRELWVTWAQDKAEINERVVIPGSAIKGPLRHRTLFHYRKQNPQSSCQDETKLNALFGTARDETNKIGGAGKVHVHDALPHSDYKFEDNACIVPHVSIDRFSGGAFRQALFSTQALWRLPIHVEILLEDEVAPEMRKAFECAVHDLKTGHLQIGADGGDGLGVFLEDSNGPRQ